MDLAAKGHFGVFEFMKRVAQKNTVKVKPTAAPQVLTVESEESSEDDTDFVSRLWSRRSHLSGSEDTESEGPAPAASEGPTPIEECRWVSQGSARTEEHHHVAQGAGAMAKSVIDDRRQVAQGRPEEEEESTESENEEGLQHGPATFEDFRRQVLTESEKLSRAAVLADGAPAFLRDRPKVHTACAKLAVEIGKKGLDRVTQLRIQGMLGLLHLYLDGGLSLSWRKTSVVVSKAQGCGHTHARRIHEWVGEFLQSGVLPHHRLRQARWTVLNDEDIASEIKMRMVEKAKKGFLKAEDVVDLVEGPEMQRIFSEKGICKRSISKKTATRWLQKLDWRYEGIRNGMYIDGHERDDVVAYRCEFVGRWKFYEKCFCHRRL